MANSSHLDGQYAAFGKVTEGMEAGDAVVGVNRNAQDRPLKDQRIVFMTVETHGADYPEPSRA